MSFWTSVKAWFADEEVVLNTEFLATKADLSALEENIKSRINSLFTVLKTEIRGAATAAPAPATPAPGTPPVAQDLVAAKNAELDATISAAAGKKAAIQTAVESLTKALT